MSRIHIIDGEKGGVGKSLFARVMIEYCLNQNLPYTLVDADFTNPDVQKLYPKEAYCTVFSEAQKKSHQADIIFELALKKPVIVNLPAQVYPLVNNWIESNRLLDIASEYQVDICKWFVCSGGYDSISLFKESVSYFKDRIPHIFVRNMGLTDEWDFLDEDEDFTNLLSKYQETVQTIDFPMCGYRERYYLDGFQLTFEAALKDKRIPILSKQRLQIFLNNCFQAIASTAMIDNQKVATKTNSRTTSKSKTKTTSPSSKTNLSTNQSANPVEENVF